MANIKDINGEQYCMNCTYWIKNKCSNDSSKKCWAANQLNGCDYFHGELEQKHKFYPVGYRPSTYSK